MRSLDSGLLIMGETEEGIVTFPLGEVVVREVKCKCRILPLDERGESV